MLIADLTVAGISQDRIEWLADAVNGHWNVPPLPEAAVRELLVETIPAS